MVRIKLPHENYRLSVVAMCDTGSSFFFLDKSMVSTLHLQGRKSSLSVAGFHGSQYVKTEIVPMAVSTYDVSQRMATVQFFVREKLKLGEQIVNLQGLKDRYPHLRNLPSNGHNLNEVLVIFGQDCSEIHHPLEFKNSDSNTATWSMKSKIRLALSCPLPAKLAATLANTAT